VGGVWKRLKIREVDTVEILNATFSMAERSRAEKAGAPTNGEGRTISLRLPLISALINAIGRLNAVPSLKVNVQTTSTSLDQLLRQAQFRRARLAEVVAQNGQ
jgi:hypothetical protein